MDDVYDSVKRGGTIAEPLSEHPIFPPMVEHMVSVGEESGQLETMLSKIADFYEAEVDAKIKALTSLIEPMMIMRRRRRGRVHRHLDVPADLQALRQDPLAPPRPPGRSGDASARSSCSHRRAAPDRRAPDRRGCRSERRRRGRPPRPGRAPGSRPGPACRCRRSVAARRRRRIRMSGVRRAAASTRRTSSLPAGARVAGSIVVVVLVSRLDRSIGTRAAAMLETSRRTSRTMISRRAAIASQLT